MLDYYFCVTVQQGWIYWRGGRVAEKYDPSNLPSQTGCKGGYSSPEKQKNIRHNEMHIRAMIYYSVLSDSKVTIFFVSSPRTQA